MREVRCPLLNIKSRLPYSSTLIENLVRLLSSSVTTVRMTRRECFDSHSFTKIHTGWHLLMLTAFSIKLHDWRHWRLMACSLSLSLSPKRFVYQTEAEGPCTDRRSVTHLFHTENHKCPATADYPTRSAGLHNEIKMHVRFSLFVFASQ